MEPFYYSPEVKFLLVSQSDEKVKVMYNSNAQSLRLPVIGMRPPFYCHPTYKQYYPVI
ncbi:MULTISPECIES: hypothetical protein [Cytobacillus]|jgi:hypothetical protein|uniref:hypothetical protein n=1 Tax=Cytobacillus TaxID=2675230 RepID=UPI0001F44D50|nr:hypothetical protein [Cytobacillus oceanisediminis]EFV76755.1 hypothetical protein HMPREF1013_02943 [Bacillus sp. 2_A_57_CT2]USK42488.1 hypothetical protein LIT27_17845 [Cytobacillus oceanisediminis]